MAGEAKCPPQAVSNMRMAELFALRAVSREAAKRGHSSRVYK